jgi:hypothetical protein
LKDQSRHHGNARPRETEFEPIKRTIMKNIITSLWIASAMLAISGTLRAAEPVDMSQRAQDLKDLKWGMFICWSFSTFYSLPKHDNLCLTAEYLYGEYLGAVKFGNIFSLDVGPDYAGKLREIDVQTLATGGSVSSLPTTRPCSRTSRSGKATKTPMKEST